jgi:dTDP-4-amino-4,6-dideoxygalactose transaminase
MMQALRTAGIGTQVHYIPLHKQPYYRSHCGELRLPGAEAYYERCLSIPFFPGMTDGDVERVVSALGRQRPRP